MANVDQLVRAASAAQREGRLAEAESLVSRVLLLDPDRVDAHLLFGVVTGKTGRFELSLFHLNEVIRFEPDRLEALVWLSIVHRRLGHYVEATDFSRRLTELGPEDAYAHNNLGLCYLDQYRLEEAALCFRRATQLKPDFFPAFHNLGMALQMSGSDDEAIWAFEQALSLSPRSLDCIVALGQVLLTQLRRPEAEQLGRRGLEINPDSPGAHLLVAGALIGEGRVREAEPHLRTAEKLSPDDAPSHSQLASGYQALGRFAEANAHLGRSLEIEPRQGFAYYSFAHNNRVTTADWPMVESMIELAREGNIPPKELGLLHYGLGRALESLGSFEPALAHFDQANRIARRLKFGVRKFDRDGYAADVDRLIATFDKDAIERVSRYGNSSELPIVIVGMMRSGTTLAEHILSSHPCIGGAGEIQFWPNRRGDLNRIFHRSGDPAEIRPIAREYLAVIEAASPERPRVTDKMPTNYELAGPIHAAFPNARFIHMRRNPIDTCLSIYATPNGVPIPYSHDRANIVFAYEQYLRLMDHWRTVIPAELLLEVDYEDLVADREREVKRILDFLGVGWDDAVLHHEENGRGVVTPSQWQVRQPIYKTSVDRWRPYEPWLGEFAKLKSGD